MSVQAIEYEKVCVIQIKGDLAGDEPAAARSAVEGVMQSRQIVDFVLDMNGCGFIDSEGLETLLWTKSRCEQMFGRVKLINVDGNCRKILELTRLEKKFECCADLPAALKMMR